MSDMSSNSNRWSALVFAGVVSSLTAFAPVFAGEREDAGEKSRGGGTIAWQKGDTVFVEGTRAGDRIVIHRSGDTTLPGEVEVWDVGGGLGTVLGNFTGVENINVDLLAGDNFLGLYRFDVAGDVNVACGDGNNQVNLGGVGGAPGGRTTIDGNFQVNVGTGNDEIRLEQCDIGDVMIDAGDGDNVILFGNHLQTGLAAYHGTILWAVAVLTGSGNDLISMIGCELGSTTTFDTQNGDDWVLLGLGNRRRRFDVSRQRNGRRRSERRPRERPGRIV